MSDMKELENWVPEPFEERPDSELNPFLDMIIQAWKEAKKGRKSRPKRHTARHLYLEIDLDKGLGD